MELKFEKYSLTCDKTIIKSCAVITYNALLTISRASLENFRHYFSCSSPDEVIYILNLGCATSQTPLVEITLIDEAECKVFYYLLFFIILLLYRPSMISFWLLLPSAAGSYSGLPA